MVTEPTPATTKTCTKCGVPGKPEDFPVGNKGKGKQYRYAYCKPCHSALERERRMRSFFGLSLGDYDAILAHQGGLCAICGKPPSTIRLAVDHDHKTGLIRGLLCAWCNRAIGQFRDDLERVRRVTQYFVQPPATTALGAQRFGLKGRVTNKAATRKRLNRPVSLPPKSKSKPKKEPKPA